MFEPETIVADALSLHPKARWVFAAYHIGGCNGCERAIDETLAEVATGYGIPLDGLLRDLNSLLGLRGSGVTGLNGVTPQPRNPATSS